MMGFGHAGFGMAHCGPQPYGPPTRYCRREAKELLALPGFKAFQTGTSVFDAPDLAAVATRLTQNTHMGTTDTKGDYAGAIIGGGCCVELAIEYMPDFSTNAPHTVDVGVVDCEGTMLRWVKTFSEGYHVKERIIVTYPGAVLLVHVTNAIARVRWCEVFSS
jgi:hypothetical protein